VDAVALLGAAIVVVLVLGGYAVYRRRDLGPLAGWAIFDTTYWYLVDHVVRA